MGRELSGGVTLGVMANVEEWTARVNAWRRSGLTTEEFSKGRGFAASTLRWYSSRLGASPSLTDTASAPKTAMVHIGAVRARERIVLEVDGVRVHVPDGVDAAALRMVLDVVMQARENER